MEIKQNSSVRRQSSSKSTVRLITVPFEASPSIVRSEAPHKKFQPNLPAHRSSAGSGGQATRLLTHMTRVEKWKAKLRDIRVNFEQYRTEGMEAPNEIAFENARVILGIALRKNLSPRHVAPSVEGGIGITFLTRSGKRGYVESDNEGDLIAGVDSPTHPPEVWELTVSDGAMHETIQRIQSFLRE